jgi:fimbrial chaperone protein
VILNISNKAIAVLILSFGLMGLLSPQFAQADMLISPMRVAIKDRERSAQVVLINTSSKPKSYRLEWLQKRALSIGGYLDLDIEQAANFSTSSEMIRMSPRQVTLQPGARQMIKLAVRRPKDLADGEYRSHLQFTALPSNAGTNNTENTGIKLNLLLNYTIPVIVRKGPPDVNVIISDAKIKHSVVKGKTKYDVAVSMTRSGKNSPHGSLVAYWTPNQTKEETKVGELNHVNIYTELKQATRQIFWQLPSTTPKNGQLRIIYKGGQEYRGRIFAEKTINL